VGLEIVGRSDDRLPYLGPDPDRDHVLLDEFAHPHAGIEPLGDYVRQTLVGDKLDSDLGIAAHDP